MSLMKKCLQKRPDLYVKQAGPGQTKPGMVRGVSGAMGFWNKIASVTAAQKAVGRNVEKGKFQIFK